MKKLMPFFLFILVGSATFAQEVTIPKDLKLETAEDYKKTEPLVLESIAWLQNNPANENTAKRKEVGAFLFTWMSGSPTVSIMLVEGIIPLDCVDCLMSFMCGWTKYSLENDYSTDNIKCAMAASEMAIEFYEKNKKTLGKNDDMEKLLKLKKKGKLEEHVKSKF